VLRWKHKDKIKNLLVIWICSNLQFNTLQYYFKMVGPTLQQISVNIEAIFRGLLTNFTVSPQQTNRNEEFTHWTNRKQRGQQRYSVNVSSPLCFHLNRVGNGNDDITSENHFENLKTRRGTVLIYYKNCSFLSKYLTSISWRAVPLKQTRNLPCKTESKTAFTVIIQEENKFTAKWSEPR
jgi:hypothetical protein